jgi:hypothetical protein
MARETPLTLDDIAVITALANGIIPADERDAGAAAVHAGPGIAGRVRFSPYADVYMAGLDDARRLARTLFNRGVPEATAEQVESLLGALREQSPAFFRLIRGDVCALYLSDPAVWRRMGFPGESTDRGGYPDFDQPQHRS